MTRTRFALFAFVLFAGIGLTIGVSSLQAAKTTDPLNPETPKTPVGPALVQPINYSHKLHAGKLGIDCGYCHTNVDKSPIANYPNVETCMNCHKYVKRATGQNADSPQIAKLSRYYELNRPIPWRQVHWLPDHVGFNHKRHVKAGIVCQDCHGPVQEMDAVYQYPSLKMGWCLQCHRQRLNDKKNPATMDCVVCHH